MDQHDRRWAALEQRRRVARRHHNPRLHGELEADDTGGLGIASYDVFVSDNGAPFTPLLSATTLTSTVFTGAVGHTYAFYSVATDNVGLREANHLSADTTTTVQAASALTATGVDVTATEGISTVRAGCDLHHYRPECDSRRVYRRYHLG
jgi:hypothetical protein